MAMSEIPQPQNRILLWSMVMVGGVAFGAALTFYAAQPDESAASCLGQTDETLICRFIGGPLEVSGQPVFVESKRQAFFPTRQAIEFIDARGETWIAPSRTLTDGASIPPLFAALIGDRQSREYLLAAAMHDAYCGVGNEELSTYHTKPWEDVHRMFYEALLVNGTEPRKARVMYAAVYLGGPRWDDPARTLDGVSERELLNEMEWCLRWMEEVDPGPDEIDAWMTGREKALQAGNQVEPDWDALFADRA